NPMPAPPSPQQPPAPAPRRAWVRWPDDAAARVRSAPAGVAALDARGAELRLRRPLPPALLVCLGLERAGRGARLVLARVTGCRQLGPAEWAVTCTFPGPLGPDELAGPT